MNMASDFFFQDGNSSGADLHPLLLGLNSHCKRLSGHDSQRIASAQFGQAEYQ